MIIQLIEVIVDGSLCSLNINNKINDKNLTHYKIFSENAFDGIYTNSLNKINELILSANEIFVDAPTEELLIHLNNINNSRFNTRLKEKKILKSKYDKLTRRYISHKPLKCKLSIEDEEISGLIDSIKRVQEAEIK